MEILNLSRQGNHWARLTIKGIHDLVNGRLHMNNIFVKPNLDARSEESIVILPGCKVTVENITSGCFRVLHFERDENYFGLGEDKKAGFYKVVANDNVESGYTTKKVTSGNFANEKFQAVAICDSGYQSPQRAAQAAAVRIPSTNVTPKELRIHGFGLHYTPGEKKIGGMIRPKTAFTPLKDESLHHSALLLAKTMYDVRNRKGIS